MATCHFTPVLYCILIPTKTIRLTMQWQHAISLQYCILILLPTKTIRLTMQWQHAISLQFYTVYLYCCLLKLLDLRCNGNMLLVYFHCCLKLLDAMATCHFTPVLYCILTMQWLLPTKTISCLKLLDAMATCHFTRVLYCILILLPTKTIRLTMQWQHAISLQFYTVYLHCCLLKLLGLRCNGNMPFHCNVL